MSDPVIGSVVYEAFLSLLNVYPGPFWYRTSNLPAAWQL